MKFSKVFTVLVLLVSSLISSSTLAIESVVPLFAKSTEGQQIVSQFRSVITDSSGNIYAVGYITGTDLSHFGNNVTTSGVYSGNNIVLVKYDNIGVAQWAKSVTVGAGASCFSSVTIDSDGNIYAAGYITGSNTYDFGNGVTAKGTYSGSNIVLVKYNSNGNAQWAKSVTAGSLDSSFLALAIDTDGNLYAAGEIYGTNTYNFGNGVSVNGTCSYSRSFVLVKYTSAGIAQWAKTVIYPANSLSFLSVAIDSNGNIYAAGYIFGWDVYDFGNSVTVRGFCSCKSIVLVKYDNTGTAQWAKSVSSGSSESIFKSLALDNSGNIYVVGSIAGVSPYNFGNNITVNGVYYSGSRDLSGNYLDGNLVLAKYTNNGTTQWAKSLIAGSKNSCFNSVKVDSRGDIYVAGFINSGNYNFGNNVTIYVNYMGNYHYDGNMVLVKYNNNGIAQLAKSVTAGSPFSPSRFSSVAVDSNNSVFTVGSISGAGTYKLGNGVTVNGAYAGGNNALLIKYGAQMPISSSSSSSTGEHYLSSTGEPSSSTAISSSSSTGEPSLSSTAISSSSSTGEQSPSSTAISSSSSTGKPSPSSTAISSSSSTGKPSPSSTAISSSSSTGKPSPSSTAISSSGNNTPLTENTDSGLASWVPWVGGFGGGAALVTVGVFLYKYIVHRHHKTRPGVREREADMEMSTIP